MCTLNSVFLGRFPAFGIFHRIALDKKKYTIVTILNAHTGVVFYAIKLCNKLAAQNRAFKLLVRKIVIVLKRM